MKTNVDTKRILLVELQAAVNLGMFFNWLVVVIHNLPILDINNPDVSFCTMYNSA